MRKILRTVALGLAVGLSLTACAATGGSEEAEGMPQQLVWSTYGMGTSTYADVAAVSEAITSSTDHTARIITADTAIGRMGPLKQGKANMARTGNEYIYAFEADYEFASEEWGPQDLQLVWAPVAPHGLMVRDSSEIKSYDDLKGARFPHITANPSVNSSLTAMLAYGGLTWDDVKPVEISYSEQADAVKSGQLDVLFQQVYGASLYELESAFPVRWLSMDDDSPEKVGAVAENAPYAAIGDFTGAAGQKDGESARGLIYTLPLITYADASESAVYETARPSKTATKSSRTQRQQLRTGAWNRRTRFQRRSPSTPGQSSSSRKTTPGAMKPTKRTGRSSNVAKSCARVGKASSVPRTRKTSRTNGRLGRKQI